MKKNYKQQRFVECINKLKALDFKGNVNVSGGLVIIGTHDAFSGDLIRKGFKKANTAGGEMLRFKFDNQAVFVWVDDAISMPRSQARRQTQEFLKVA